MKKYKHLSQEQRYHIYALRKAGFSQKSIAQELQVSPSTICREIQRNKGLKGYRPQQAHRFACHRRSLAARLNVREIDRATKQRALELIRLMTWNPPAPLMEVIRCENENMHKTYWRAPCHEKKDYSLTPLMSSKNTKLSA